MTNRRDRWQLFLGFGWLLTTLMLASQAQADTQRTEVGPAQVGLLELYTSEGCNSCPPADRFFSTLVGDPSLFESIVPIAFHVDYWNYLGWPDRFSTAQFSERQRDHVRAGRGRTVYTPGFFYNGAEWRQFFGGDLTEFPDPVDGGWLSIERDSGKLAVEFKPRTAAAMPTSVEVALLGFGLETDVRAGENRGRTLRHDFVVLELEALELDEADGTYRARGRVPTSAIDAERFALAVWVRDRRGGEPLQAAGLWLP
ncbi:MAG: DUF1223 domain-containing protein [Pseudomonadota bacterium]